MTRVLVTGASGFIGSRVVRSLLRRGDNVVGLVRSGSERRRLEGIGSEVAVVEADLDDPSASADAVQRADPEGVIHCAWYVEPGRYLHAVPENLAALEASVRLLRLLLDQGCDRIVLVGTSYEPAAGGEVGRVEPPQAGIYRAAKAALHEVAMRLAEEGHPVACAHIFYLYGPGESERRLVPLLVRSLLQGETLAVTDGEQRRDYLHVDDVADALRAILAAKASGSIDVCSGDAVPLSRLFDAVERATGREGHLDVGGRPYGEGEVIEAVGDPGPLRDLGWTPSITLEDGIADTVEWWIDHLGSRVS